MQRPLKVAIAALAACAAFAAVPAWGEAFPTKPVRIIAPVPQIRFNINDPAADLAGIKADLEQRMKETLGVKVTVSPKPRGALDSHTGTAQSSKVKRVLDRRSRT